MKYILCEEQEYDDLTRYVVEVEEDNIGAVLRYLEKDFTFGEVIMISDTKPETKAIDQFIVFSNWVKKEYKELLKTLTKAKKELEKAKKITQEDLNKEYDKSVARVASFISSFKNSGATYSLPLPIQENIKKVRREKAKEVKNTKSLIEIIDSIK